MSEADKMFEDLGYTKHDNHPEMDEDTVTSDFVTQDCRQIEYSIINFYKEFGEEFQFRKVISFFPLGESIVAYTTKTPKGEPASPYNTKYCDSIHLNYQEMQAICKKCEELGYEY